MKIGKLVATTGLNGEVILRHNAGEKIRLKKGQPIFIEEKKGSFLPWFIASIRTSKPEEAILMLEVVTTRESAMRILKKEVWLREADHRKLVDRKSPAALPGYFIFHNKKELGEILEIFEQPNQLLCRLDIKGKEVLIPLHEESLLKIDHKNKRVYVNLPDGLLEIYLGE